MGRSREQWGRHRQPWIEIICPACGLLVQARRAKPPKLHVHAHFTDDGVWCACVEVTGAVQVA